MKIFGYKIYQPASKKGQVPRYKIPIRIAKGNAVVKEIRFFKK
tara:strand:+ start:248 stop:376 length:129 start_codon:yes stop_codon:yes gene_type:complete